MARDDHRRRRRSSRNGISRGSACGRRSHRALVVQLASELYRRDHGSIPLWDEALVGPYLKELPPDGLADGDAPAGPAAERSSGAGGSTEQEPMKVASNTGISRNFPTLKYLAAPFRWLFGSRRRALTTRRCSWR